MHDKARHGNARQGKDGEAKARQGKVKDRHGKRREARQGMKCERETGRERSQKVSMNSYLHVCVT